MATVKYFGKAPKKFGLWVGLELDEPTGDKSGEVNGENLFECRENHALVLRNTQVKVHDGTNAPVEAKKPIIPSLASGIAAIVEKQISDSPLVSPTGSDGMPAKSTPNSIATSQNQLAKKILLDQEEASRKSEVEASDGKAQAQGWREKIAVMKLKKEQQAKDAAEKAQMRQSLVMKADEADRIRASFAPSEAIGRDEKGDLVVDHTEETAATQKMGADRFLAKKPAEVNRATMSNSNPRGSMLQARVGTKPNARASTMTSDEINAKVGGLQKQRMEREARQQKLNPTGNKMASTLSGKLAEKAAVTRSTLAVPASGARERSASRTKLTTSSRFQPPGRQTVVAVKEKKEELPQGGQKYLSTAVTRNTETGRSGATSARGNSRLRATNTPATKEPTTPAAALNPKSGVQPRVANKTPLNQSLRATGGANSSRGAGFATPSNGGRTTPSGAGAAGMSGRRDSIAVAGPSLAQITQMKKLEEEIKEKQKQVGTYQNKITDLNKKMDKMQADHKTALTKGSTDLKQAVTKCEQKLEADFNSKVQKIESENKAAQAKISAEVKKERDGYEGKMKTLQKQLSTVQTGGKESEAITSIKEEAEQDRANALQAAKDLELYKTEHEHALDATNQELDDLKRKLTQAEKDLQEQIEKTEQIEQSFQKQETEQMEHTTSKFQDQKEALEQELSQLKKKAESDLEEQKASYEAQIAEQKGMFENDLANQSEKWKAEVAQQKAILEDQLSAEQKNYDKLMQQKKADLAGGASNTAQFEEQLAKVRKEAADEKERQQEEYEILELEMEEVKEQKNELMEKMLEQSKMDEDDPLKDMGVEELKNQNRKLRMAVTSLTMKFEEERKSMELQLNDKSDQQRIIEKYEEKLKHMDFLLEEVDNKEADREEMEQRLEEMMEYETMVEEMVADIEMKDKEIEDMTSRVVELEEGAYMMEELNNEMENYNKQLTGEMGDKDVEISQLKKDNDELGEMMLDGDSETQKYKSRLAEIKKANEVLVDQMKELENTEDSQHAMSKMLERQQQLSSQLMIAEKKDLKSIRQFIVFNQSEMRSHVISRMLTESLERELMLETLGSVESLNQLRHRSMMLIRDVTEKQIVSAQQTYAGQADGNEMLFKYATMMIKLALFASEVNEMSNYIHFQLSNMTIGQYRETSKLAGWRKVKEVRELIDEAMDLFKEEAMPWDYSLKSLETKVEELNDFRHQVQNHFMDPSPEDVMKEDMQEMLAEREGGEQKRRMKLAHKCNKLSLRKPTLNLAIGVAFLQVLADVDPNTRELTEQDKMHLIHKGKLVYWRLLELILKIDFIGNKDPGEEYLNMKTLFTDQLLEQKFTAMSSLWEGKTSEKQKNWITIVEAAERDITTLSTDFNFRKLTLEVETNYNGQNIDFNDLYSKDPQSEGPWVEVAIKTNEDIKLIEASKQTIVNLKEKHKEQSMQIVTVKKEKDDLNVVKKQLESKLSQTLAKVERIPAMELELKDQLAKVTSLVDKLNKSQIEVQARMDSEEKLRQDLQEAKEKAARAPQINTAVAAQQNQQPGVSTPSSIKAGGKKLISHVSRASRTSTFFTKMVGGGLGKQLEDGSNENRGHARNQSVYNNTKLVSDLQQSQDVFINIVNDLQADRARLKGREMRERLQKLDDKGGAFSYLLKKVDQGGNASDSTSTGSDTQSEVPEQQQSELGKRKQIKVALTYLERNKVEDALRGVDALRGKAKHQMARARIVDLTKKVEEEKAPEASKNEQLNYMIVETREKISEAMSVLFSNDSRLRNLSSSTEIMRKQAVASKNENLPKVETKSSEMKIGEVRISGGQIPNLPKRKLVLDESHLIALKQRLQIFVN